MKRILLVGFWLLSGILRSEMTFAYEVLTHQDISQKALEVSVLSSPSSVLTDLQLKAFDEKSQKFPGADEGKRTILDLVLYGAEQEDDLGFPGVGGSRFMHHFYDPIRNSPLTNFTSFDLGFVSERFGVPYQPIQKSPTWTLEDNGDFPDDKLAGQIFSYKDARGYFYKALTEFSKTERDKYFGLMFQTLGHVIHHIQDMAQPQHVKNEQHPLKPRSLYEKYTDGKDIRPNLPFTGYGPVDSLEDDQKTFDTPRKFWSTSNGTGKGLAEFTNYNFVTYGHNFTGTLAQPQPNEVYLHPQPVTSGLRTVIDLPLAPHAGLDQTALDGKMYFIKAPVTDAYRPSESGTNNLASAYSLYDDDLTRWNLHVACQSMGDPSGSCTQQAVFTVNRFTMSAAHNFLIPRAVGYSAGMINYFFRGKLSVDAQTQPGRLVVKNEGPELISGHFTLYYDDAEGNRYAVVPDPANSIGATPWPTPTEGMLPGQTLTLPAFAPPPTALRPAPKTPGEYMLVFRGMMGQEQDIAVAAKKISGLGAGDVVAYSYTSGPNGYFAGKQLLLYPAGGTPNRVLFTDPVESWGLMRAAAFDAAGNLYALNEIEVLKFDASGTLVNTWDIQTACTNVGFGAGLGDVSDLVVDVGGTFYLVGRELYGSRVVIGQFTSTGVAQRCFYVSEALDGAVPPAAALAPDGCTMLVSVFLNDTGTPLIERVNVCTGVPMSPFYVNNFPDGVGVTGLQVLPTGDVLLAYGTGGLPALSEIVRLNPQGQVVQTYDLPGDTLWHMGNNTFDGSAFWALRLDFEEGYTVNKFDLATGALLATINPPDLYHALGPAVAVRRGSAP